MSATAGNYPLHECLKQFLSSSEVGYLPFTARLVSLSPAQALSQDNECFLEVTALSKDLLKDTKLAKTDLARSKVLIRIADWKFIFSKIPNSSEYYLDIDVKSFEVLPPVQAKGPEVLSRKCINILEINPYARLYEEAVQRLAKGREEGNDFPNSQLNKGFSSGRMEQKGEMGSNQNKYSFRTRYPNPNLNPSKDPNTTETLTLKKNFGEGDASQKVNIPGIRVSGINGKQNMKKLKEFKRSYITASQDSITNQVLSPDQIAASFITDKRNGDSPPKTKHQHAFLKKRIIEDNETSPQRPAAVKEDLQSRFAPISDRDKPGTHHGISFENQVHKKLKLPQRSDFAFKPRESSEEALNYDELLDCLSIEKGLVHWEDLIFSKDVVKYLKHNISDLLDKK